MPDLTHCPRKVCGKELDWQTVHVGRTAAGAEVVLLAYADCSCGYGYTYEPVDPESLEEILGPEDTIPTEGEAET